MRKNKIDPPVADFAAWAAIIEKRIRAARLAENKRTALLVRETAWGTAADCVFRYTVLIDEAQLWGELDRHLGRSPGPAPSRPGMVMRLVERHCGRRGVLSASQRSRLAESLELARTCGVDPALVVGFLCEIGGQRAVSNFLSKPSKLEQLAAYRRTVDRS